MEELARVFTVKVGKPGDEIVSYGSKGNEFYIILKGTVDVLVPNTKIENWRQSRFNY